MSFPWQYYLITVLVYLGVNLIALWALNLQFGYAGVLNFGFVLFQAVGAYIAAVLSLGSPAASGGYQQYVLGARLPWPLPLVGAFVAGGLLAAGVGWFALKPARRDFQAVVMLVVSLIAAEVIASEVRIFNGSSGVAGVPKPLFDGDLLGWGWLYVGIVAVMCAVVYACVNNLTGSPWGRRLRAMRDNPAAARAMGTNVQQESLKVYVLGGALAGLSGGVLVEFIGAWAPGSWSTGETFLFFVALIVGGLGNNFGALVGGVLVLGVFEESVRYLPNFSLGIDGEAIQALSISLLILAVLWLRPAGIVPERRRRLAARLQRQREDPPGANATSGRSAARDVSGLPTASSMSLLARAREPRAGSPDRLAERPEFAISVQDLRISFGSVNAVDGVSFDIPRGQLTGLIGPNGAGKSTVLKAISGWMRPTDGRIMLEGEDVTRLPTEVLARRGLRRTFQLSSEFGRLTVLENLLVAVRDQPGNSLHGALPGRWSWRAQERRNVERAMGLLKRFGMAKHADDYAGELSGGEKRLVEIMRALMAEPSVLLLDEPLAGVNPSLCETIEAHLRALRDDGLTMVIVEHELGAIERMCDSVIVLAAGRVLAEGTMASLRANPEVVDAYLVG